MQDKPTEKKKITAYIFGMLEPERAQGPNPGPRAKTQGPGPRTHGPGRYALGPNPGSGPWVWAGRALGPLGLYHDSRHFNNRAVNMKTLTRTLQTKVNGKFGNKKVDFYFIFLDKKYF